MQIQSVIPATAFHRPATLRPAVPLVRFKGDTPPPADVPAPSDDLLPLSKNPWLNIRTLGSTVAGSAGGFVAGVETFTRIPYEWLERAGILATQHDPITNIVINLAQLVMVGMLTGVLGGLTGAGLGKKWADRALRKAEEKPAIQQPEPSASE